MNFVYKSLETENLPMNVGFLGAGTGGGTSVTEFLFFFRTFLNDGTLKIESSGDVSGQEEEEGES